MENNNSKVNTFLIFIVILALVGTGFYFINKNKIPTTSENPPVGQNTENNCTTTSPPSINILSPNGGEVYKEGQSITVTWESCNLSKTTPINILLQANFSLGSWNTSPLATLDLTPMLISGNLLNSGEATFTLPTNETKSWTGSSQTMKYGKYFRIYISQNIEDNIDANDMSDNDFTINSNSLSTNLPEYVGAQSNWPPVIKTSSTAYSCVPGTLPGYSPTITQKTINGKTYCVSVLIEDAAGSRYGEYTYTRADGTGTKTTNFVLRWSSCDNYDNPKRDECKTIQTPFFNNLDTLIANLM